MWARCVAEGVPDEVFWSSRLSEVRELVDAIREREDRLQENANLRAGLVAATMVNMWSKKGARTVQPQDFFRRREPISAERFRENMLTWAREMQAQGKNVVVSTKEIEA